MNFLKNFKDSLKRFIETYTNQFQESELYQSLQEKYLNLSRSKQKQIKFLAISAFSFVLYAPIVFLIISLSFSSKEYSNLTTAYNDFLKNTRSDTYLTPITPNSIYRKIETYLLSTLLPEQITKSDITKSRSKSKTAPYINHKKLSLGLEQLNINQVFQILQSIPSLSSLIKIMSFSFEELPDKEGYFKMDLDISLFGITQPKSPPKKRKSSKGFGKRGKDKKDDEKGLDKGRKSKLDRIRKNDSKSKLDRIRENKKKKSKPKYDRI